MTNYRGDFVGKQESPHASGTPGGLPAMRGPGTAEPARFAHGVHVGLPLSAYVSTNSGKEERRDEIMGPTTRRWWLSSH